jgi:hypothetical protein
MMNSNLPGQWPAALLPSVIGAASMALAACNGGGVTPGANPGPGPGGGPTVTATPYSLFASNYIRYIPGPQNGAFLHTIQGGDVFAVTGGEFGYGCFDFDQPTIDGTQLYLFQAQANPQTNCAAPPSGTQPPSTAGDFFLLAIKSPGSPPGGQPVPFDISQSNTLLIQMGNDRDPSPGPNPVAAGHVNKFTLTLTNDTSLAGDNSAATAVCKLVQTLDGTGKGTSNYPPPEFAALGARDYAISLTSPDWSCSKGSIDELKTTGVTAIAVIVTGDENPNVVAGEFDNIILGKIGFTK